jgi:hypothetical protein
MGFFKNIMMKGAMKAQMKGLPADQQERLLAALEKDPEFFENIAKQIDQKKKQGKGEMEASMEVMRENQDKLRKLMM